MKNFDDFLLEQLSDPTVAEEYTNLNPEYEIIQQLIAVRIAQNLTQSQLAKLVGIKQSNISRLESGNYNPTLSFLKKIAKGLGKTLHIEFRDKLPNTVANYQSSNSKKKWIPTSILYFPDVESSVSPCDNDSLYTGCSTHNISKYASQCVS